MVLAFGLGTIIISADRPTDPGASRYLDATASTRGKPSITVEAGRAGTVDPADVSALVDGSLSVMRLLKMLPGTPAMVDHPVWIESIKTIASEQTGIFYPLVARGTYVAQGMTGRVRHGLRGSENLRGARAGGRRRALHLLGALDEEGGHDRQHRRRGGLAAAMTLAAGSRLGVECIRGPRARAPVRTRLAAALLSVWAEIAQAADPAVTIIKAARLIDGRGVQPMGPVMVRIEGERIAEVGPTLAIPAGARVIDLGGATLLPGLIDLHTHLTDRFGVHWEEALTTTTPPEAALWGAKNARETLMAGFTTCREMGPSWPYVDVALRNAIDQEAVPGPRLFVAGNYVSSTGGAGDARQFSIYVDVPIVKNLADGPEEVTRAVRTNFKNGADFIKILVTGAMLSKGISPERSSTRTPRSRPPSSRRAAGAARSRRTPMAPQGIKAAIRAGVRTVDHGSVPRRRGHRAPEGLRAEDLLRPHVYRSDAIVGGEAPTPRPPRSSARVRSGRS